MKTALVTGGSGTIGQAICHALAGDNMHVIVHANQNRNEAEKVAEEISSQGGSAEAVCFDVTEQENTARAIEELLYVSPIQILVNNAGIHDDAPLAGMSAEQWNRVIDVTLNGFYNVTQPLLLPMIGGRWGRIISISSIAGVIGNRGQTNYAAAKAGLHGASKSLSQEVGSRGITVNVIAPGIIATPKTQKLFPPDKIEQLVPMKRAGAPKEVADLAAFLASEKASYISGQIIGVNGGMA